MTTLHSKRGAVLLVWLLVSALIGAGAFALRPKALRGETKRASAQVAADKKVEDAHKAEGASVAASLTVIAQAAEESPASKQKDFIVQEVPVALAKLPTPDPLELLHAEQRKTAVLEGQLSQISKLYAEAAKNTELLQRKNDAAQAAVKASNTALLESAAADAAKDHQFFLAICAIGGLAALYLYKHATTLPLSSLASAVVNIKAGGDAVTEIDSVVNRFEKGVVRFFAAFKKPDPSPVVAAQIQPPKSS